MAITTNTVLMPIDPAVSPQQIARILPIKANLLPTEILAHRNARRTRVFLIAAAVIVVVLLALWYVYAIGKKSEADDSLAAVTSQVQLAQQSKAKHKDLTDKKSQLDTVNGQLADLLAKDLRWSTMLDKISSTGTSTGATVSTISGTLISSDDATANSGSVATLAISGTAPDKKTVANFIDALGGLDGIADPYLTVATQNEGKVAFTATADITDKVLCGRFTKDCPTGGN